jgi:phosphonoacetaldehyde hydrolase
MGMLKIDHIRELFKMERIRSEYVNKYGSEPNEQTVQEFYGLFEKFLFDELSKHIDILPGVLETVEKLRANGILIGSTSGYTQQMMDILMPLIEQQGYKPDYCVPSSAVPQGRPYPWMIFQNAVKFGKFDFSRFVKVGDTLVDIGEGVNSNCWSVGVLEGSSLLGLSKDEYDNISPTELSRLKKIASQEYMDAGADFVINTMADLPDIIEKINKKLLSGELPGNRIRVPQQDYLLFTPGNFDAA